MRARKEAHADFDRTDGLRVAAVDAATLLQNRSANDVGLEALDQLGGDELLLRLGLGERLGGLGANFVQCVRPLLLVRVPQPCS